MPEEIAGRDEDISAVEVTLRRAMIPRSCRSIIFHGLRGVGKTVLLVQSEIIAEDNHCIVKSIEASDDSELYKKIIPALNEAVLELKLTAKVKDLLEKTARAIRDVASIFKISVGGIDVSVEASQPSDNIATGDIQLDLPRLILSIGEAAKENGTAVALVIDEIHTADSISLEALVASIHKCNQRKYPVILIGAGLPSCLANLGNTKSYSERLFDLRLVGALSAKTAREAIVRPLESEGVSITDEALDLLYENTSGYPFFIQVWGQTVWNIADGPEITADDVRASNELAIQELDDGFFKMRFDRCSKKQKRYLRAMTELGDSEQNTNEIADILGVKIQTLSSTREALIKKGMIYSPKDSIVTFTVPLFANFMKRTMPFAAWDAP